MDSPGPKGIKKIRSPHIPNKRISVSWVLLTLLWTFTLSLSISFVTNTLMTSVALIIAFLILFMVILLGIIFDIIGIAVTAALETPFHSMAADRVRGAEQTIFLIRNAEKVSNFCNDVIGDVAGIISGATGTAIASQLLAMYPVWDALWTTLLLTAIIAALTVGGKALGKTVAMSNCNTIVYAAGLVISVIWPAKHKGRRKKKHVGHSKKHK